MYVAAILRFAQARWKPRRRRLAQWSCGGIVGHRRPSLASLRLIAFLEMRRLLMATVPNFLAQLEAMVARSNRVRVRERFTSHFPYETPYSRATGSKTILPVPQRCVHRRRFDVEGNSHGGSARESARTCARRCPGPNRGSSGARPPASERCPLRAVELDVAKPPWGRIFCPPGRPDELVTGEHRSKHASGSVPPAPEKWRCDSPRPIQCQARAANVD